MTKSTITREQLEEWVAQFDEDGGCDATDRQLEALIRQSLAAMDSEPVFTLQVSQADYKGQKLGNHFGFITLDAARELKEGNYQLYTAQPAPEYPETLPCPVLLEPGLRFGKGIKTSTMLAALARRSVHESDMAALSPEERAEFQTRIEDFKTLIAQPAPVVPDAYMRDERGRMMLNGICEPKIGFGAGWNACRAAMLQVGNSPAQHADRPVAWYHTAKCKDENHSTCCFSYSPTHDFGPWYEKPQSQPHYLPERLDYDRALHFLSTEPRKVTLETVIGGNSPVIPDGYVMVPKDLLSELRDWSHPEIEKYCEMWEGRRDSEFPVLRKVIADADALLAAAPQPQNAQQNIPEIIPGWIPVSERMPEPGILVLVYTPPQPDDYPWDVRIGFDYIDPDCDDPTYWFNHGENYEEFYCVACDGMTGPSEKAPYTHWIPLPAAPQEVR